MICFLLICMLPFHFHLASCSYHVIIYYSVLLLLLASLLTGANPTSLHHPLPTHCFSVTDSCFLLSCSCSWCLPTNPWFLIPDSQLPLSCSCSHLPAFHPPFFCCLPMNDHPHVLLTIALMQLSCNKFTWYPTIKPTNDHEVLLVSVCAPHVRFSYHHSGL